MVHESRRHTCIRNQTFVQCCLWKRITSPAFATGCIDGVRKIRFIANRRRYYWPVVGAIIGPWPYLRVIRCSSLILKVEQTSFEKPYAACFELVDSATQLHAPLGWTFPTLGRFEDLTHAPADVSFDTLRKHCLRSQHRDGIVTRELRIQVRL